MPGLMELLSYAGNALDLPASSLRDLVTGNNPFDQWATPFSSDNRTSGRDMLNPIFGSNKETGMAGWLNDPMEGVADILGFGAEMLLDPLNAVSGTGVVRALKGRKAAKSANKVIAAENASNAGKYGYVNAKLAGQADELVNPITQQAPHWQDQIADLEFKRASLWDQAYPEDYGTASLFADVFETTDDQFKRLDDVGLRQQYDDIGAQIDEIRRQNPMKLLGYTPERPTVYHGGHDWSASATPENPYGMFDVGRLKTGEGANIYGPGAYFAEAESTSERYRGMVADKLKQEYKHPVDEAFQLMAYRAQGRNAPTNSAAVDEFLSVLEKNDWLGFDPKDFRGRNKIDETLMYREGVPDEVLAAFDRLEETAPKARLYQLDMPPEAADRFIAWDNPIRDQPQIVKDMHQQAGYKSNPGWDDLYGGHQVAEDLLGARPASAYMRHTEPLTAAGISGTKNLAASTGRNTYNYAIWDQDLLNQMRIRAIDGQRVPINPTTLVQQVTQPLPQVADPTLMRSMNPMRPLQQLPGLAAPAAKSAVYNVFARQNNYGGVM